MLRALFSIPTWYFRVFTYFPQNTRPKTLQYNIQQPTNTSLHLHVRCAKAIFMPATYRYRTVLYSTQKKNRTVLYNYEHRTAQISEDLAARWEDACHQVAPDLDLQQPATRAKNGHTFHISLPKSNFRVPLRPSPRTSQHHHLSSQACSSPTTNSHSSHVPLPLMLLAPQFTTHLLLLTSPLISCSTCFFLFSSHATPFSAWPCTHLHQTTPHHPVRQKHTAHTAHTASRHPRCHTSASMVPPNFNPNGSRATNQNTPNQQQQQSMAGSSSPNPSPASEINSQVRIAWWQQVLLKSVQPWQKNLDKHHGKAPPSMCPCHPCAAMQWSHNHATGLQNSPVKDCTFIVAAADQQHAQNCGMLLMVLHTPMQTCLFLLFTTNNKMWIHVAPCFTGFWFIEWKTNCQSFHRQGSIFHSFWLQCVARTWWERWQRNLAKLGERIGCHFDSQWQWQPIFTWTGASFQVSCNHCNLCNLCSCDQSAIPCAGEITQWFLTFATFNVCNFLIKKIVNFFAFVMFVHVRFTKHLLSCMHFPLLSCSHSQAWTGFAVVFKPRHAVHAVQCPVPHTHTERHTQSATKLPDDTVAAQSPCWWSESKRGTTALPVLSRKIKLNSLFRGTNDDLAHVLVDCHRNLHTARMQIV